MNTPATPATITAEALGLYIALQDWNIRAKNATEAERALAQLRKYAAEDALDDLRIAATR